MKITWDKKAKAVYIYLAEGNLKVDRSAPFSEGIYGDYSKWGTLVGIEILYVEKAPVIEED